ncbi:uncharacterized protein KQ657_004790 [Scheffersomyces spartinae]|uniref:Uncharacterized protein n=1 Tax=Scheffersomyces spartinae TaxID=45513 RepID=A0A9P7V9Z9_9ASCO|nr:uncharacterized protein KQ657_004790 [Scheffersomyces spartinae]KAG7194082.1 hypothetical protein KQ657_004790 [Scheffersomyces spartinae]
MSTSALTSSPSILNANGTSMAGVNEPLQNNFLLEKRRRMSIQAMRNKSGFIPRSSALSSHPGLYQDYATSLEEEHEGMNNHLERRLSTTYNSLLVKDTVGLAGDSEMREQSPLVGITESMGGQLSPPPVGKFEAESTTLRMGDDDGNHTFVNNSNYFNNSIVTGQALVESEYAPLYTDEEGNLVRPPFINLDPKERYELLKLKRAMRERQHLENRLKYMVDPNETSSTTISKNMVETSTQTRDPNYLEKSLHFVNLKRKLKSSSGLRNAKRRKNNRGYFVAEFFYDVTNEENNEHQKSVTSKYDGYLGLVSKPLFKAETGKVTESSGKEVELQNTLKSSTKIRLQLDSDFIKEKESLANVVKIKEPISSVTNTSSHEPPNNPTQPSAGFTFNINKTEIQNIVSQRKELDKKTSEKAQELKEHHNNDEQDLPRKKRAGGSSLFGSSISSTNVDGSSIPTLPKLSFGSGSQSTSGSLFGSGTQALSKSSGGLLKPANTTKSTPSFSFGLSQNASIASKGKDEQGTKKGETASSSLLINKRSRDDDNKETESKTPIQTPVPSSGLNFAPKSSIEAIRTPLFGGNNNSSSANEIPKFTFGASTKPSDASAEPKPTTPTTASSLSTTSGESTKDTSKPVFSFRGEKKDTTTPSFSFGAPVKSATEDKNTTNDLPTKNSEILDSTEKPASSKPLFAFGDNDGSVKPAGSLAFTFGGSEKKTDTIPKPSISFGGIKANDGTSESPKPFNFGAPAADKGSNTPKPLFSFGSTKEPVSTASKPLFGLGTLANASTSTVTSQPTKENGITFSFGDTANKDPAQIFGASSNTNSNNKNNNNMGFTFGLNNGTTSTKLNVPGTNNESVSSTLVWGSGTGTPISGAGTGAGAGTGSGPGVGPGPGPGGFGFSFGGANANANKPPPFGGSIQPQGGFTFGESKAEPPQFGFSRETTPVNNSAGGGPFASPAFGGVNRAGGIGSNPGGFGGVQPGGFNFTGSISSKENTPDPAMIFGGIGNNINSNSANNVAGGFGNGSGGFDAGTGPVIASRKIAHPRRRGAR